MPLIQTLSPHLADLIAAGEVVERPASVVKELLENAIDAGASAVIVELRGGGMSLIRVSDNGCGIAPEELPTAFLRHATSKLRAEEDLSAIGTLGFRGEALAAIAAVSHIEIASRRRGGETGARLCLNAGVPGAVEEYGCPEGTAIFVRDLFFNTPARMKFMKKDSAEAAAAAAVVQQTALSHPRISFKLLRDGAEQLYTPGDGKLLSAIYAALGRDFALSLLEAAGRDGPVVAEGYVTKSLQCRGTRSMQHFFVNGRYVKSPLLAAALEEGYKNQMMKGKFPGCVLHLSLPLNEVDVNVHPAKTVVKFLRERAVFDVVYHTVRSALERGGEAPAPDRARNMLPGVSLPAAEKPPVLPEKKEGFYRTMTAGEFRAASAPSAGGRPLGSAPARPAPPPSPAPDAGAGRSGTPGGDLGRFCDIAPVDSGPMVLPLPVPARRYAMAQEAEAKANGPEKAAEAAAQERDMDTEAGRLSCQETLTPEEAPWRIAGEVLRTYIVAEDNEGNVWLIDKHAAHERINFDRLKAMAGPVMGQQLLAPEAVALGPREYAVLLERLPLLNEFGFSAEDFGNGTILCRTCPAELEVSGIAPALEEIAAELLRTGRADPKAARDAILHTMACKAAIKAGMTSDEKELRVLVDKVQRGEIQFCPHGRPVRVKLSGYELEKMFKRA